VTREVEHYLGQPLTTERPQAILLRGTVEATEAGYAVRIVAETLQGRSERSITHRDCRELAEASALVMALAIDPELFRRPPASSPPSDQPSPGPLPPAAMTLPPASPPPPPWTAPPSSPRRRRSSEVATGTIARVGWGVLSNVDFALGAEVGFGQAPWRIVATGYYWVPRHVPVAGFAPARVDTRLLSAAVKACLVPAIRPARPIGCIGGELGDLRSEGERMTASKAAHRRWAALVGGIGAEWPLGTRLAFGPGLDAGYVLERHPVRVRVRGGSPLEVVSPQPWLVSLTLGLRVTID
jgi:hypothetical protein